MRRTVKREAAETSRGGGRRREADSEPERPNTLKKEKAAGRGRVEADRDESTQKSQQAPSDRRVLRSQYLALINKINDVRDDLSNTDSDRFTHIISEVENLHQLVQKPREQIADAEALLDIANTLVSSVKSHSTHGVTPAEFISGLVSGFGQPTRTLDSGSDAQVSISWKDIGLAVCATFSVPRGCCTMLGPMNTELKQRKKNAVTRKRTRLAEGVGPEEVDDAQAEEKTDTDKNMAIMFDILRRKKRVRLESLILNRKSFAQTVENLFALSFLAKDGRVEIIVDESGSHFVSPRNAPAANSVMSGEVSYNHFVFRFDFKDWKLMMDSMPSGEELMPHRQNTNESSNSQSEPEEDLNPQGGDPATTPIRKLTRNRGLVIQEQAIVQDSPDNNNGIRKGAGLRRIKRKLH